MPIETSLWNEFSGWSPNDDAINGRKSNLLQMTNLELDRNGSLSLANGTTVKQAIGDSPAHTLYSKFLKGTRHDYTSLSSGKIYRDATLLSSAGSATRTGFSTAFDNTLIASAAYRVKDSGTGTPANLGITAPTVKPTLTPLTYRSPAVIHNATDVNAFHGAGGGITNVGGFDFLTTWQVDNTDFGFVFATYDSANVTDTTVLTQTNFGSTTTPFDVNDIFVVEPYSTDGSGNPNSAGTDIGNITQIQVAIYLAAPGSLSPTIEFSTDYFTYTWTSDIAANGDDVRLVSPSKILLAIRRSQFQRVGSNTALDWNHVVGYAIAIQATGAMSGTAGIYLPQTFQGGYAGMLTGNIQYAQMNVAKTASYTAKSTLGPISILAGATDSGAAILAQTPADPQVTEVWIFRRDGGLEEWYRILVIPIANVGTAQIDNTNNSDAETLDVTVNLNLVAANSTGITEDILDIIGPIEGRWYYITPSFLYPSDIYDPDLIDASEGIRICGAQSEVYLWSKKISEAVVLIGTSIDIYILSGTFITLPDGTIDIFYRPLGCKFPPIAKDAAEFGGLVYYLSDAGWMAISPNGQNQSFIEPTTSLLYHSETRYGYTGITLPGNAPGSVNYPIVIIKAKMYCMITGTGRIEVYDFIRQYWRPVQFGLGDISAMCNTQDGQLLGYFAGDNKLRVIEDESTKLIDGAGQRNVQILSVAQDGGHSRNRKDLSTFKSRIFTGGVNFGINLITDQGTFNIGLSSSNNLNEEIARDISGILATCKWWQFQIYGTFNDFLLQDCSVDADIRPTPLTFLRGRNNNFGTASKKRVRTWPFVIDTRGGTVTITPYVDNVAQPPVQFSSSEKSTELYQFLTDVFGIDYGYTVFWDTNTEFEFYGDMNPEVVHTLPVAHRFDQIGPVELWRYGKIQKLDIRVLPFGGTQIPWKLYFSDQSFFDGIIDVLDGQEGSYTINIPKGASGSILRVEFGPTNFDFHRYNIRILTTRSGTDTDGQWITLG